MDLDAHLHKGTLMQATPFTPTITSPAGMFVLALFDKGGHLMGKPQLHIIR